MIVTQIQDAGDGAARARVTSNGELVTGTLSYSEPYYATLTAASTATIVAGKQDKRFVITGMVLAQDRTNTDTTVTVYEADEAGGAAVRTLGSIDLIKSQVVPLLPLNIVTGVTRWIEFSSDSGTATINVTILGYYAD